MTTQGVLRTLRRQFRKLWRRLRPPAIQFVYDRRYESSVSGLPWDPLRADRILTFLAMEGLISRAEMRRPKAVSMEAIRAVHADDYLEALQDPQALSSILGIEVSSRDAEQILLIQRRMVGGTIEATELARRSGGVAANLGGGFHHARRDRGGGFCVFNDVAIAIAYLRKTGFEAPILVIDLDLHDGEGTREIFAADSTVHTFSIHNNTLLDEPAVAATVVALGNQVEDGAYLQAVHEHLPPVLQATQPGLVFYLAGCDPAADDAIGNWRITGKGMLQRDLFVFDQVRRGQSPAPLVIVTAGGYGPNAWRYNTRFFASVLSPRPVHLPSNEEMILARYRFVATLVGPWELTGLAPADGDPWAFTEADLFGSIDRHGQQDRLLGYYSLHGLEFALERMGIFSQIHALGFKEPTLSMDLADPSGHRLRVYGDGAKTELLMELLVHKDLRTIPGMEMLVAEWLLLQNPRLSFTPERPRLPGQTHPGLGLLAEVVSMLVLVCDRLQLDGLLFTPAHFHTALISARQSLRFLRQEDEDRFQAIRRATAGMSLGEASWALEEGRLTDPLLGQTVQWRPEPMVLPVTEKLKTVLHQQWDPEASPEDSAKS